MKLEDVARTPTDLLRRYVAERDLSDRGKEALLLTILERIQALEEHARDRDPNFKPAAERG